MRGEGGEMWRGQMGIVEGGWQTGDEVDMRRCQHVGGQTMNDVGGIEC